MPTKQDMAVIVPVRVRSSEEGEHLGTCLEALARLEPGPAEVVVVDDGSTPPVALQARPGLRLLRTPPRGPAAARNAGAAATSAPVLVFVDADIEVPGDALGRLAGVLEDRPAAVAAWATVSSAHPHRGFVSRYKNHSHRHFTLRQGPAGPEPVPTHHLTSMLVAVHRSAFQAVGGFDEGLTTVSVEDVELGRALYEAGGTVLLLPELQAVHHHRFTPLGAIRNDFHKARRHAATTLAHRRAGHRSTTLDGPGERRQLRYLLGVPLAVGALAALLGGRWRLATLLTGALAWSERDLLAYLAREEGPAFALRALPWMVVERTVVAGALVAGTVDHLRGRTSQE